MISQIKNKFTINVQTLTSALSNCPIPSGVREFIVISNEIVGTKHIPREPNLVFW